jgi:hypothetical protein
MEGVFLPGSEPAGYWGELDRLPPRAPGVSSSARAISSTNSSGSCSVTLRAFAAPNPILDRSHLRRGVLPGVKRM